MLWKAKRRVLRCLFPVACCLWPVGWSASLIRRPQVWRQCTVGRTGRRSRRSLVAHNRRGPGLSRRQSAAGAGAGAGAARRLSLSRLPDYPHPSTQHPPTHACCPLLLLLLLLLSAPLACLLSTSTSTVTSVPRHHRHFSHRLLLLLLPTRLANSHTRLGGPSIPPRRPVGPISPRRPFEPISPSHTLLPPHSAACLSLFCCRFPSSTTRSWTLLHARSRVGATQPSIRLQHPTLHPRRLNTHSSDKVEADTLIRCSTKLSRDSRPCR